ncbi:MAG: hypothetical protein IID31_14655, partial [Planctomycetes bacterium]|nr:hypothetical protein [Planctomycetota bacterium]
MTATMTAAKAARASPDIDIAKVLGQDADDLLGHVCRTIPRDQLHLPGPDFIDRVVSRTDRSPALLRNFQTLLNSGRLGGTGHVSILP